jgi:hypothetical protein
MCLWRCNLALLLQALSSEPRALQNRASGGGEFHAAHAQRLQRAASAFSSAELLGFYWRCSKETENLGPKKIGALCGPHGLHNYGPGLV